LRLASKEARLQALAAEAAVLESLPTARLTLSRLARREDLPPTKDFELGVYGIGVSNVKTYLQAIRVECPTWLPVYHMI
jgi:hypothetical protein